MTKEILISITGLQLQDGQDSEQVKVITAGDYYFRNGRHYIMYDEMMEGFSGVTKNMIKISSETVEITKKGITNVHMVFEKGKSNVACYETPMGNIMVGLNAGNIEISESEDALQVVIDYALEMNFEHLANCNIQMEVHSREDRSFRILS